MNWIDTHSHIYLPDFDTDRKESMQRCLDSGVVKILLPNIDLTSIDAMHQLKLNFADQVDMMMGIHPCSVDSNYVDLLDRIEKFLHKDQYYGIGEIGLDLYWDKSTQRYQEDAFRTQLSWSIALDLPVSIHSREATEESLQIVEAFGGRIKGVFHCFSGSVEQARRVADIGMYLGIGGVLTYKKSELPAIVENLGASCIVLETDAPYLSPVPHRGRRNESSYIPVIGERLAEVLSLGIEQIAYVTTENARKIYYPNAKLLSM